MHIPGRHQLEIKYIPYAYSINLEIRNKKKKEAQTTDRQIVLKIAMHTFDFIGTFIHVFLVRTISVHI